MPGPKQEITLLNTHQEPGSPENLWKVMFASTVPAPLRPHDHVTYRVMYVLITPDQWHGDIFKLMDWLGENKLNPGLPKVWIQATNIMAMQTSSDKWMLNSMDTLHERAVKA